MDGIDGARTGLDALPETFDRAEMCRLADNLLNRGETVGAFVVAMVWGHGDSGYGGFRTRRVLTGADDPAGEPLDDTVVVRLAKAVDVARDAGAVEGYRYLNNDALGRVKHLGPAFFTKWLYAATARGVHDHELAAPVLDDRVLKWVNANTELVLRPWYTDDYAAYVRALSEWGERAEPRRSAVAVEEAIFDATARA